MLCVAAALGLPELVTAEMVVTADTPKPITGIPLRCLKVIISGGRI